MTYPRVISFVALLLLPTGSAIAQDDLLDTPRQLEQVTFSSPTTASIRLTTGVRRTGSVLSISRESIVYQVGRDNKEVRVPIDEIERVNTLDGEFTYVPAREDFERLKIKARRISYLYVETVETYIPPPDGVQESQPPPNGDPAPTVPDPVPAAPEPLVTNPPVEATAPGASEPTAEPSVEIPDDKPQPGQLVLFCSNCQGRLPFSIKNGDECPHCGLVLYNLPARQSGSQPSGAGGSRNPGSDVEAYPEVSGNQSATGANGGTAPGNAAGGGHVTARGFSLSDVPAWMQIGFFVGLLAVGWILLQRR